MSDNVGLSTPRGSGTSGYVQRNRAFIRPRDGPPPGPRELERTKQQTSATRFREPDQGILDHSRKRAIEVQVFALRDELEEKGDLDDDTIDERCDDLRKKLTEEAAGGGRGGRGRGNNSQTEAPRRFKTHQIHEQARAKIEETERIRRALHINKDYQEGGHWRRQEEKQAQKRKKEEEEIEAAEAAEAAKRREEELQQRQQRRYDSDDSRSDYSGRDDDDAEDGEIRGPIRSVEDNGGRGRGRGVHDDDDNDLSDNDSDRGRGRQDGRRVRQRRDPSGASSRSDSRSRSRTPISRSPSRSPSRSLSRSRSRSRSRSSVDSRRSARGRRSGGRGDSNDS